MQIRVNSHKILIIHIHTFTETKACYSLLIFAKDNRLLFVNLYFSLSQKREYLFRPSSMLYPLFDFEQKISTAFSWRELGMINVRSS